MFEKKEIQDYVNAHKEEALRCLMDVLQSPSPTGSEKPMADTVLRWLKTMDLDIEVYEYQKDRPNYIAAWKGDETGKNFLFNGHMDVFPATETTDKNYNPWSGEVRDGWVYGRGASDMKSGDSAAMIAVKFLQDMGFSPKGTITLNFVSDEESGGEYGILSLLREKRLKGDFGISMEPSSGGVVIGHGGTYPCRIVVHGDGGHAATPIPANDLDNHYGGEDAIKKAMKAVAALNRLQDEVIDKKPATPYGKSHLAVTKINAGIAVNNYPRRAEICIDRRYMPNETPESVDAEIIGALDAVKREDPTFVYEFYNHFEPDTPTCSIPEDSSIVIALDEAHEAVYGQKPEHHTVVGGADAAYIKAAIGTEMPWYGPGDLRIIASSDERVEIERYLKCIIVYMLVLVKLMS
ncbi:MAG: M20/M25/M40 family metallo-hydrolase [Clostridiales bacterium]|nr:M20/M25/M40 family metallo-hydrolase [Clostridiales bacterium]